MGEIRKIEFQEQSGKIKERVQGYWSKRVDGFYELRHAEIESNKAERWLHEIEKHIPKDRKIKILDVGCGAGFFEIILGREGHEITGIDLTEEMITKANDMILAYQLDRERVKATPMDAENLDFDDESFDMVISRNLTWTLPHPIKAYEEWHRVLKKGGVLLNFDAEYAKNAHAHMYNPENLAHQGISDELKDECHDIYHMLTISTLERPMWDMEVLKRIGFDRVESDIAFGDRIYIEKDQFYMLDRMFSITAWGRG